MPRLKLLSSHEEAGNIRTFVFEAGDTTWIAGQHDTFVLEQAGADKTANRRWFTIASAPSEKQVWISTRMSDSPFKQALAHLQPGDTIEAQGVVGKFVWEEDTDEPVTLVAGGIGITPFRSFLLERAARGKPLNATLLYFNRDEAIAYRDLFDRLAKEHPEFQVRYLINEPITAEKIDELTPLSAQTMVFLSGPKAMVDNVGNALKARGVPLKQDWFPGYDEQTY